MTVDKPKVGNFYVCKPERYNIPEKGTTPHTSFILYHLILNIDEKQHIKYVSFSGKADMPIGYHSIDMSGWCSWLATPYARQFVKVY